jgi:hypothetical protein
MAKFSVPPDGGCTRLCLDPWAKCFIRANGDVWLCCNGAVVGSLADKSLPEILDGSEARRYRLGLLAGSPEPACRHCPDRRSVPIQELTTCVEQYLSSGEMNVF